VPPLATPLYHGAGGVHRFVIGAAVDARVFGIASCRLQVIRDRVAQVAKGFAAGLFQYGRPGISKTHTVIETLTETVGEGKFTHDKGHLTPIGLFELLEGGCRQKIL
jgi:hypothetical protein